MCELSLQEEDACAKCVFGGERAPFFVMPAKFSLLSAFSRWHACWSLSTDSKVSTELNMLSRITNESVELTHVLTFLFFSLHRYNAQFFKVLTN